MKKPCRALRRGGKDRVPWVSGKCGGAFSYGVVEFLSGLYDSVVSCASKPDTVCIQPHAW